MPVEQRGAFLDRVCEGDDALRIRVEGLLRAHREADGFMASAPVASASRPDGNAGERVGDRVGRYKLLQQIGEGGCGVVFMAEQEDPVRRRVALKVVKPGMDTRSVIARFEAERQALALMDHPNIAKVFDAGATESGRPYFVMELIRGIKITDYCDQHSLTTEERLLLFIQVCHAVQHAHQKGIIHRDIKPSNILVTATSDGSPLPVVIDFGIAKATSNQRLTDKTLFTAFEMLIGTPAYMSPEQAVLTSVDVDTRSDIYSLGVLLYELLTGSTPFDTAELLKSGLDEVRRVIREQDPLRPSTRLSRMADADLTTVAQHRRSEPPTLIRAVSGDLDWIAMKAMEKDRARRYETASSLAVDVQRYLSNEPISARPPNALYRLQKTIHRHRFLFAVGGVVAVLLVVGLIVVSASLARERKARHVAETEVTKSRQITRFLKDLLESVGPSVARGQDTKMLAGILDQMAQRIGKELTHQPAVEAELRGLMGRVYLDIGRYDRAEEMQRIALEINRKLFGSESKETASALNDLGLALWREHRLPESESAHKEALVVRRNIFGDESTEVAESLNHLGDVYRHYQRPNEAEPFVQQALAIRRKLFGETNLVTAESLRVLSILRGDQGRWAEAEALATKVLEIRRTRLGSNDVLVAGALGDVSWAAANLGKWDEAERLGREELAIQRDLLDETHPAILLTLRNLGSALQAQGRLSEAESFHREALALWRQRREAESPKALPQVVSLVSVLMAQNKLPEAERELDDLLSPAFIRQTASADVLAMRAGVRARRGHWSAAASDASIAVGHQPGSIDRYHGLAPLLAMAGDRAGYEQLCREIITAFGDTTNPNVADKAAKDCLLLPAAGVDLKTLDRLADVAVSADHGDPSTPYFRVCKALVEYRLGRQAEAIEWAEKVTNDSPTFARAHAHAVLAMANWELGRKEAAAEALARGDALAPVGLPAGLEKMDDAWLTWLFARISLDEAAGLINAEQIRNDGTFRR